MHVITITVKRGHDHEFEGDHGGIYKRVSKEEREDKNMVI